jgi:hypothetical protein
MFVLVMLTTALGACSSVPGAAPAWRASVLPERQYGIGPVWSGLVCTSVKACVLSGFDDNSDYGALIWATGDSGRTWSWRYHAIIPGLDYELDAMACSAHGDCLAMGSRTGGEQLAGSTDGAEKWYAVAYPRFSGPAARALSVSSVTCTATLCFATFDYYTRAGGAAVARLFATADAGHRWEPVAVSRGPVPDALVACEPAGTCWAFARSGFVVSRDEDKVWHRLPDPPFAPRRSGSSGEYACSSVRFCLALTSGSLWLSNNGGHGWKEIPGPGGGRPDYEVADCLPTATCLVAGDANGQDYLWEASFAQDGVRRG